MRASPNLLAALTLASTLVSTVVVALPAHAGSGVYTGLSFGYGALSGTRVVITDDGADNPVTDPNTCCPGPGIGTELRLGFSIEDIVAPEFVFIAHGWDIGGDAGGAGFLGGGIRVFPAGLIGLTGLDVKDFQETIVLSIGAALGYTLVGKDFAYAGSFFGVDLTAEYLLTEVISLGARLTLAFPTYGDFTWTDYGGDIGRCLGPNGEQLDTPPQSKASANCAGRGPSTSYLSPQLTVTFHFDIID